MINLIQPPFFLIFLTLTSSVFAVSESDDKKLPCKDLRVKDSRFEKLFKDSELLEHGGTGLATSKDGKVLLVAVGFTTIKNQTPKDIIRQLKVSSIKAKSNLLAYLNGEFVQSIQSLVTESSTDGEASNHDFGVFKETILIRIQGRVGTGLEPVATWKSPDGELFYQALGFVLDPSRK